MKLCFSGGTFDYKQHALNDIIEWLDEYIYGHECDEEEIEDAKHALKDRECMMGYEIDINDYIIDNKHTMPNRYEYNKEVMHKLKLGLKTLQKALVYAQRIDWLMAGDDGEDSFLRRLEEELKEVDKPKSKMIC